MYLLFICCPAQNDTYRYVFITGRKYEVTDMMNFNDSKRQKIAAAIVVVLVVAMVIAAILPALA